MRTIYLDYAATTPMHPAIEEIMRPYLTDAFGNPSSTHGYGRRAREAVEHAREQIANAFGCAPSEIIFTSGGTEADNSAIVGSVLAGRSKGRHIVTTAIEHHAVHTTCEFLQSIGYEVTYVKPDSEGIIRTDAFLEALREDTVIASCMWVNNETGAIQPVADLADECVQRGIPFHTDAVQAAGILPIHLDETRVSMMSISAHKLYGPKGVGALIARGNYPWNPLIYGGSQERGRRAGTENVPAIVGFGAAVERASANRVRSLEYLQKIKHLFVQIITNAIEDVQVHSPKESVPSIVSLEFKGVKNELLLMNLDLAGIAASSGSACTAGSLQPSHVLLAMGLDLEAVRSSVRFSFSEQTTEDEIQGAAEKVVSIVKRLRG